MRVEDVEKYQPYIDLFAQPLEGDDPCHVWTGNVSVRCYGMIGALFAHRVVYAIHHKRDLQSTDIICHKCDFPGCVNPDHLFLGTVADNNWDKSRKGRCAPMACELNPAAKLTAQQVLEIRELKKDGFKSGVLAEAYGVNRRRIWSIFKGLSWASLQARAEVAS